MPNQRRVFLFLAMCVAVWPVVPATAGAVKARWKQPALTIVPVAQHPAIACSQLELKRLREAYAGVGPNHAVVARVVDEADQDIKKPLVFPPRGGQHNQWYQCDKCQIALQTIDATHHRCPRCKTVYSGEPYDDVVFSRQHGRNLQAMRNAAWAYALTGQDKYAKFARQVLIGYAQRYSKYPRHSASRGRDSWAARSAGHLYEQTLTEASAFCRTIAPAYDLIHDWNGLSATDHRAIRNDLILPLLNNTDRNHAGKSNWQTWHNAAFMWGGALLGDSTWIRKAIADPENGFLFQMEHSVTADGMWFENSWGYHFYTLSAMVEIAEVARHLHIDLWGHPTFRKMFTVAFQYVMPNQRFPRFGDDVNTSIQSMAGVLEYAYGAVHDPSFVPFLATTPTWTSVMLGRTAYGTKPPVLATSCLFPGAGHAILRTAGPRQLAAAITFGPYGGFHGHLDKLSFVLFGCGAELGYDPGRARSQAYRLPIHRNWYKATLGHNAVLVDQKSQQPSAAKLEFFGTAPNATLVVATCDSAYPGVEQRRLLCLTPDYLLIHDRMVSAHPHRYDWVYHNRAAEVTCPDADQTTAGLAETTKYGGQEYVEDIRIGRTNEALHAWFRDTSVVTQLTAAAAETTVRTGNGAGSSVVDRVPLIMLTRTGKQAEFTVVLEPTRHGSKPAVTTVSSEDVDGVITVTVQRNGQIDRFLYAANGTHSVTLGGGSIALTPTVGR